MSASRGQVVPRSIVASFARVWPLAQVALIEGPRACGKSTVLAILRSRGELEALVDLSDPATRSAAAQDPSGFLESLTPPLAIDEIQLVPDLMLAVKSRLDRDPQWGPCVFTGSSPVGRGHLGGSDPLVGRAVRLRMRPLSRREITGRADDLLAELADPTFVGFARGSASRDDYIEMAGRSGFPVARSLSSQDGAAWFGATYVDGALPRTLADEGRRVDQAILRQTLRAIAASPAHELNVSRLAQRLEVARSTLDAHLGTLTGLGLIDLLTGWRPGAAKRHIVRPKLHASDGALAGWSIGPSATDTEIGGLIESMVFRELASMVSLSLGRAQLYHWRHQRDEIDIVLEVDAGLVPIEVKLSRSVPRPSGAFAAFARAAGSRMQRGLIFYAGDDVVPVGRDILAVPISALWETAAR